MQDKNQEELKRAHIVNRPDAVTTDSLQCLRPPLSLATAPPVAHCDATPPLLFYSPGSWREMTVRRRAHSADSTRGKTSLSRPCNRPFICFFFFFFSVREAIDSTFVSPHILLFLWFTPPPMQIAVQTGCLPHEYTVPPVLRGTRDSAAAASARARRRRRTA
jgi:hypothetical protein